MEKIKNRKYERIDKIWRKAPIKLEECKLYEICTIMETFNSDNGIDNIMPIISEKVFDKINFQAAIQFMENVYGEEMKSIKLRTSDPVKKAKSFL